MQNQAVINPRTIVSGAAQRLTWADLKDYRSGPELQRKVAALSAEDCARIVCERNHATLTAGGVFDVNAGALREMTRLLMGRSHAFQDEEWNILRPRLHYNAVTRSVTWAKPTANDNGIRKNIWMQPEFGGKPLLASFYAVLAQASHFTPSGRETKFLPVTGRSDKVILRPLAYDYIDRTQKITAVPVKIGLHTRIGKKFVLPSYAPIFEVSEPSARELAEKTKSFSQSALAL